MKRFVVVSNQLEALSAQSILPNDEIHVWDGPIGAAFVRGRPALIWLNRQDGYRETVDLLAKTLLRSCSTVTEIVNELDGIGLSPSEASLMMIDEETFSEWSQKVKREHSHSQLAKIATQEIQEPEAVSDWHFLESIELPRAEWKVSLETGKRTKPNQHEVSSIMLGVYGSYLIRDGQDVFFYTGSHWQEIPPIEFKHMIRRAGQAIMGGHANDKELNSYYNAMMDFLACPAQGESMYLQKPNLSNFEDGTLEVLPDHSMIFREHRTEDLLTWVLPYRYKDAREENPVFRDWLDLTFGSDPDGEGKIRALKQIAGACLVSMFPRVVFLKGEGGTGKSTFANLCASFVGPSNVAGVEPAHMNQSSFMMEGLINKQVNIVTDISEARIDSATFKRIEDRSMFYINRKGRKVIMAHIPAIHMFCCNALPRGIDGASTAMDRRLTIVEFNQSVGTEDGTHIRNYEKHILTHGAGAVLQFCLDGLADLCASRGVYFNPESGKQQLKEWKSENDPVSLFLDAIANGDYSNISFKKELSMRASVLWITFQEFKETRRLFSSIGRNRFYAAVRAHGVVSHTDRNDTMMLRGIGSVIDHNPANTGTFYK